VSGNVKLPSKFSDFHRDLKNKQELIEFFTKKVSDKTYPSEKELYITSVKYFLGTYVTN